VCAGQMCAPVLLNGLQGPFHVQMLSALGGGPGVAAALAWLIDEKVRSCSQRGSTATCDCSREWVV